MVVVPNITLFGGYLLPMLGLGTWLNLNDTVEVAIDAAMEAGYRHIDTAYFYDNEYEIGRALKKWFDSGKLKREDIFITTKLPYFGMQLDKVQYYMDKSLENFGVDYVDLYLIHFPVGVTNRSAVELATADHVELWKKMEEQVDAGKARSIGLSNFNMSQVERIKNSARIPPAALEVEVHVMFAQKELVNYAQRNDIVVIGFSPLAHPGYNNFLASLGQGPRSDLPDPLGHPVVKKIAKKHNKKPAQILVRFLHERNIVTIPKSETPSRIRSNIDVFDFSLDAHDMRKLYALERGEEARVLDFKVSPVLQESSEWPFEQQL